MIKKKIHKKFPPSKCKTKHTISISYNTLKNFMVLWAFYIIAWIYKFCMHISPKKHNKNIKTKKNKRKKYLTS